MRYYHFFLAIILYILTACNSTGKTSRYHTPLYESDFKRLTTNKELTDYVKKISETKYISYEIIAETSGKQKIPLVKISKSGSFSDDKLKILIVAGQHGNEPSAKEGALLLLQEFAEGNLDRLLENTVILLIPQINPYGGDKHQRQNAENIDLNRDHVLMRSTEIQALHKVFNEYLPEVTVDVHEYCPYRESWYDFGWLRQFDIQLGINTNINIHHDILYISKNKILPFVQKTIENQNYSFLEYTVGSLAHGERLIHSTVDIDDGRQSMGIQNSFSFIIEGLNGKDSLERIEARAVSQKETMKAIIAYADKEHKAIKNTIKTARIELVNNQNRKVGIKLEHIKGNEPLQYTLQCTETGKDSMFFIEEYHSNVISLVDVKVPKAYLIPSSETDIIKLLDKHEIVYLKYNPQAGDEVFAYFIEDVSMEILEELEVRAPKLRKENYNIKNIKGEYIAVPTGQLKGNALVLMLEPESTLGLVNYPDFEYLMQKNELYPILRLE